MENRIKECQLDLFADRTSAATMRANQLRLWFASMAYVLVTALRRIGFAGTEFAAATCGSIRLKLLKIGALVTRSVRRIRVAMASSCPDAAAFRLAHPDYAADPSHPARHPTPPTNPSTNRAEAPCAAGPDHCAADTRAARSRPSRPSQRSR